MITIDSILCPVDLSDCSRHGFNHAAAIARWYGASIMILHVFEMLPVVAYGKGDGSPGDILTPAEGAETLVDLEQMAAAAIHDGLSISIRKAEGRAHAEILRVATEMKPDLLVVGTHGRSGFQRLMLGSVTEKVLRRDSSTGRTCGREPAGHLHLARQSPRGREPRAFSAIASPT